MLLLRGERGVRLPPESGAEASDRACGLVGRIGEPIVTLSELLLPLALLERKGIFEGLVAASVFASDLAEVTRDADNGRRIAGNFRSLPPLFLMGVPFEAR